MKKIEKVKNIPNFMPTFGELPTSYLVSMTYEEQIIWLCNYVEKTIQPTLDEITDKMNEVIDIGNQYEEYLEEVRAEVDELENEFEAFKEQTEMELNIKFNEMAASLNAYIENQFNLIRYDIQVIYNELDQRIDDIIAGDILIQDPTTGLTSPIQVVIDNIFDMNRNNAITASEFDGIELTASGFDAIEITAFNFDINGKDLLNA